MGPPRQTPETPVSEKSPAGARDLPRTGSEAVVVLHIVDAFTDQPFAGNPAAVALLDHFPSDRRLQAIAREVNLSETAFLVRREPGLYDLRWFTPAVEVDLCGHATLAAAHLLIDAPRPLAGDTPPDPSPGLTRRPRGDLPGEEAGGGRPADPVDPPGRHDRAVSASEGPPTEVVFQTRSGRLACRAGADGIAMDFPADPPVAAELPETLPVADEDVLWYGRGRFDAVLVLSDASAVRRFRPDLARLAALGTRAVIVTAAGDRPGVDCVSRVFAPNAGVAEDPVTGSAHCTLAELWGDRLGRDRLVGEQASPRGGIVRMERRGERVTIGGEAVTVGRLSLFV